VAQIGEQVRAPHLDLVHFGLQVAGDAGLAHGKHVRHRHRPALAVGVRRVGNACAQRQPAPGDASGALLLEHDARHQRFMRIARLAVALQRGREQLDASIADTQRLASSLVAHPFEPPSSEQLDLDHVLARPAGRAPDLAQSAAVGGSQRQ
jgi:hypothetical protein